MYLYLQCSHGTSGLPVNRFHCRGEVGADDDMAGYAEKMKPLEVLFSEDYLGDVVERAETGGWRKLPRARKLEGQPQQTSFAPESRS